MGVESICRSAEGEARMRAWYDRFRARLRSAVEERTVATSWGETHVLLAGPPDAPPLVVLHGAMATSAHVLVETEHLAEGYRLIAPDIVGHSVMSSPRRPASDGDGYGRWFVELLDGLGVSRPSVYAASWGGLVALRAVAHAPDRIDRLVLLCPAGIVRSGLRVGLLRAALPMMAYRLVPTEARLRSFVRHQLTTLDDDWMHFLGDAVRHVKLDFRLPRNAVVEDTKAFRGPVYVLGADDDVHFPGPALLERARELFPQAVTELLADTRHGPAMDDASRAALSARVAAFLAADPARV